MKISSDKEGVLKSDDGKDQAAVSMGRRGGVARAAAMTPERRVEIAKAAALKRWASRNE